MRTQITADAAGTVRLGDLEVPRPAAWSGSPGRGRSAGPTPQVAIAWLLARSAAMLPIPGTSKVAHLGEDNVVAASSRLDPDDRADLTAS